MSEQTDERHEVEEAVDADLIPETDEAEEADEVERRTR